MSDVDHPTHYNAGKIEVIDFIEDQQLGFHLGNTVKYIARSAHKGSLIADLEKAQWYLARYIILEQERRAVEACDVPECGHGKHTVCVENSPGDRVCINCGRTW